MQSYNMGYTFLIVCALISYTSGLVVHENVVFHKTNEVSSNHARWLVTFIHDLRPYEVFIDKINMDLDMTHVTMKTLTDCIDVIILQGMFLHLKVYMMK